MRRRGNVGFTVSASAEARHAKPVRFVEDASARTRAVTLEDVPEFVEARRRRENEARARVIANGGLIVAIGYSAVCRLWGVVVRWLEARRRAREKTDSDGSEAEAEAEADAEAEAEAREER